MNIPKPADSTWTDDQWNAIVSTGQDILVALAAGSGKTAVLVERMIRKITAEENPIDVDRLLVVTFTNASAAEMKHRIAYALEKELVKRPGSSRYQTPAVSFKPGQHFDTSFLLPASAEEILLLDRS